MTTPTVSAPGAPEFGVTFALTAVLAAETPAPEAPAAICPVSVWARLVEPVSGRLLDASAAIPIAQLFLLMSASSLRRCARVQI